MALLRFEVFEFHDLDLLARKKFEDALELASIKSSLEIGKTARLSRRRAGYARFFFSNRVEKIQRLVPLYRCMFQWANARSTGFRRRISNLIFGL